MTRLTALLLVAAIGGAGCGSGHDTNPVSSAEPAPAAKPPEAAASRDLAGCALATPAEISTAIDSPVADGESYALKGCAWTAVTGAIVRLSVFPGGAETCTAQESLVSGRQEKVAGLGDSALWGSSGDLVVCSSAGVVKVDIEKSRNDPRKDREALIAIARAVMARI